MRKDFSEKRLIIQSLIQINRMIVLTITRGIRQKDKEVEATIQNIHFGSVCLYITTMQLSRDKWHFYRKLLIIYFC